MAPHHVLEDPARALVAVERAGDRLDRAGRDLVALAHQVGHLAHDGPRHRDGVVVAVERQHVAPQEDLAVEVLLERLHHHVARAGELRGDLVGKLELGPQGVSISFTAALTRLPSARPFTCGITRAHHLAHLLGRGGAGLGHGVADDRVQLLVRELLGHVGRDDLSLALLGLGGVGPPAVAVGLRGLEAALALALEDLDGIAAVVLLRLLESVGDQAQRMDALAVARLERGLHVILHLVQHRHLRQV